MYEGLVNILKAPGMSSSDAVTDVRRIFSMKRVGHTGTLDPGAAGVLGICLGRATRLFDLLVDKRKEYIAEIAFGVSTDTQDSYGRALERSDAAVDAAALEACLGAFRGRILQKAPLYSAIKVDGRAMYAHARAGHAVEQKTREAEVYALELLSQTGPRRFLLKICCGRGTYIRTICHDIGLALDVPAHMSFLLRSRAGAFAVGEAYSIPELAALREDGRLREAVIAPEDAVGFLPAFGPALGEREKRLLVNGAPIAAPLADGQYRLFLEGRFIGVGKALDGRIHLDISFL